MKTRSVAETIRHVALVLATSFVCAASLCAQTVDGTVIDKSTRAPVQDADVVLLSSNGKVTEIVSRQLTDSTGRFALEVPKFGAYAVKVSALGYKPYTSGAFTADTSQEASIQVTMTPAPVALKGLSVRVAAMRQELKKVGFYKRQQKGIGDFVTPKQIIEKASDGDIVNAFYGLSGVQVRGVSVSAGSLWDITMPGATTRSFMSSVKGAGPTCYPSIYLDGDMVRHGGNVPTDDLGQWTTLVNPNDVAGIEVYPTTAGAPAFAQGSDSPCGAVVIWTKTH
jgi:hypothetical protein